MRKKPIEFFHTYRAWQGDSGQWYVVSNLTSPHTVVCTHPDRESARNHARDLNALWLEEFYATRRASAHEHSQPHCTYRSESLVSQLRSSLAGIVSYLRYRFR